MITWLLQKAKIYQYCMAKRFVISSFDLKMQTKAFREFFLSVKILKSNQRFWVRVSKLTLQQNLNLTQNFTPATFH
jgi:hypothetical protein